MGILDINHARSHIHDCGKALYADDPKKARAWGKDWSKRILKEGPEPLLAHLKELSGQPWSTEGARLLKNLIAYVETHREHMKYPEFVTKGYPIASGAVEGTNKHLMISRCRRSGQTWTRANLQHLLTLRTALVDDRWDRAMEKVRARQAYPARPVRPAEAPEETVRSTSPPTDVAQGPIQARQKANLAARPPEARHADELERIIPWRKRVKLTQRGSGPWNPAWAGEGVATAHP